MNEFPQKTTENSLSSRESTGSTGSPIKRLNSEEIWNRTPAVSRMNSMECWDYTIELECLQGPEGLTNLTIIYNNPPQSINLKKTDL
jgi:hypothetical protein